MLNYYYTNKMFQIKGSPQHHANIFYAFNRAMSRDLANHLKNCGCLILFVCLNYSNLK